MTLYKFEITHTEYGEFDTDLPEGLVEGFMRALVDGKMGSWSPGDIGSDWRVVDVKITKGN